MNVFFNGHYIEKTDEFLANTSIQYQDEFIAIWKIVGEIEDFDSLTASIVHEMFHGFQNIMNESRWANENEALINYQYRVHNLSGIFYESKLIHAILKNNELALIDQLKASMVYRKQNYPFEFTYESKIQQIEGTALFVELKALEQLDQKKAEKRWNKLLNKIQDFNNYFPIRIISYSFGAALLACFEKVNHNGFLKFSEITFFEKILEDDISSFEAPLINGLTESIETYHHQTKNIIEKALSKHEIVFEGKKPILSVNIWDARYLNSYIVTNYFIALKSDQEDMEVFNGNFVVKVDSTLNALQILKQ